MASASEVALYRAGVAKLLEESVATTRKLERWLNVTGGWREATAQVDFDADPTASVRIMCALLLRKARLHTVAVLQANETNNMHSLAVQMRPVLECAGQVVFLFHNLIVEPELTMERESALNVVGDYLNADYYQRVIGMTRGGVDHKELLETTFAAEAAAAASVGMPEPKTRKGKRFKQADKVAALAGGNSWYDYLSEYFSHGRADWTGLSWRGGVMSIDTVADEFTFAGLTDYLVEQVAVMNAYASLCPVSEGVGQWIGPTLAQLRQGRETSGALRDAVLPGATGGPEANARTG